MTPEYDDYGILIKRPTAAKPAVDEYGIAIKKKSGGDVSTSGSGITTTSTSSGDFPLLYDRKVKTESLPATSLSAHQQSNKNELVIPKTKSLTPLTDKEAEDEARNQISTIVSEGKTDDPLKEALYIGDDLGESNRKVFTQKLKLLNNAFPTGNDAKEYLNRTLQIDPFNNSIDNISTEELKQLAGDNHTKQAAIKRLEQHRDIEDALHGRTLDEASLIYAAKSDPQVKYLLDKAGGVGGFTGSISAIPLSMRGEKKLQFLMNPDVKELAANDPELKAEYNQEIANFPVHHPEFATKLLADAIAKKREETGGNNWFANVVGKESTDKIVDELIKEGSFPESYRYLYKKPGGIRSKLGTANAIGRGIGNAIPGLNQFVNEGPIPTPGLLEHFEQGAENFQTRTAKSLASVPLPGSSESIINSIQPEAQQVFNTLEKQYSTPTLEPKGLLHKASSTGGDLLGFVTGLIGGTEALNATKLLNPQVAQATAMVLATHGDNNERAKTLFPGEKLKQGVYTGVMDILNGVMGKYLPGQQIPKLLRGGENVIASTLNKMVDGEITTHAAKGVITNFVTNSVKGTLQGAEFMGAIAGVDDLLTQTLQGKGIDFSKSLEKGWDAFKIGLFATGPLSAMEAGLKSNKPFRNEILSMADRPDYYKELATREAETNPDFAKIKDDVIENIDFVSKVKSEVSGKDWTDNQKKDYIINSLGEKVKLAKAEASADPTIKKQYQKEAKSLHEIKEAALKGIPPEKVKENQAIKEVKELYDMDYISGNSKKAMETIEGENGKPKFDENKVKGFMEEVAQQSNNVMANKEFDKGTDARKSAAKKYPSQLIDLANDMFPEYKKIADEADLTADVKSEPIELNPELPEGYPLPEKPIAEVNIPAYHVPAIEVGAGVPEKEHKNISTVVSDNKAISEIGTPEEYYQYLKTVFPDSKVNGKIFFHRGGEKISKFDKSKLKPEENAFYFKDNTKSEGYGKEVTPAILNIKNPSENYPHEGVAEGTDASIVQIYKNGNEIDPELKKQGKTVEDLTEYAVYHPDQIHILGSKEDIAGFKKWKETNETKETTEIPNKAGATSANEGTPPEAGSPTEAGTGEEMRLTHADTEKIYKEGGLPERLETPTKHLPDLEAEANKKLEKGYDFDKVAEDVMEGKHKWEDSDQLLFAKKAADLKAKQAEVDIRSPQFDQLQTQIEKLSRASDVAGTETGRALQARKNFVPVEETISDYITREKEAAGVETLTEQQKGTAKKEYEDITAAKKAYEEKIQVLHDENARLRAAAEVKKAKPKTPSKQTKEEFKKNVDDVLSSIKKKWKDAGKDILSSDIPYRKQLAAIAPDVAKLVKMYAGRGITELTEIVQNIHGHLKEEIKDLKEKDIIDLISGKYNEKKKPRNELARQAFELKREAQYINKLEALLAGEEPKSEKAKVERNRKIAELKKQIKNIGEFEKDVEAQKAAKAELAVKEKAATEKDLTKAEKEIDAKEKKEKREQEKKTPEERALAALKTKMTNQIKELEYKLKTGDFDAESKPDKEPVKLDKEAQGLSDKLIKLKSDRNIRLMKLSNDNKPWIKRVPGKIVSKSLNSLRVLKSSFDVSMPFRQGIWAVARQGLSSPIVIEDGKIKFTNFAAQKKLLNEFGKMYSAMGSEKVSARIMDEIRSSPRFEPAQEMGLNIADPESLQNKEREDAYGASYLEQVPVIGRSVAIGDKGKRIGGGVKASERAATTFVNTTKWNIYNEFADSFEKQGKTLENAKKDYEAAAIYANQAVGRGKLKINDKYDLEKANAFTSRIFFSLRLQASRLQLLTNIVNPVFYARVPKEVRVAYLKDAVKFVALGMTTLAIANQMGLSVGINPFASNFGKIRVGNTEYDIWGGFSQWAVFLMRFASGQSTDKGGHLKDVNRVEVLERFARSKESPELGIAHDLIGGTDYNGQPTDVKTEAINAVIPLVVKDVQQTYQDGGVEKAFITWLLASHGVGVQTYDHSASAPSSSKKQTKTHKTKKQTKAELK